MEKSASFPITAVCAGASIAVFIWLRRARRAKRTNATSLPEAEGGLPLLGHALQYKEGRGKGGMHRNESPGIIHGRNSSRGGFYMNQTGSPIEVAGFRSVVHMLFA